MQRNPELVKKRAMFVKLTIESPEKAVKELHELANALLNCKHTEDKLFALSQIFCVSEQTVEKDLYREY